MIDIEQEVFAMERMTVDQLRKKYAEVFGEPTNGRNKRWLIKRIAWRIQANAEGDLSERARRRAMELANDADLRVTAPRWHDERNRSVVVTKRVRSSADNRLPAPGTILQREYKGQLMRVTVLTDGFEFQGQYFRTLSAVARAITGKHWNGFHFFGLGKRSRGRREETGGGREETGGG